jgi:hypothetical protein
MPYGMIVAALRLLNFVQADNRYRGKADDPKYEPPITGRFPYRLTELLAPYQEFEIADGRLDYSRPKPISGKLRQIATSEMAWVISRQCEKLEANDQRKLLELCEDFLSELESRERPLCEFYNLFAIEAFVARQGD